LAEIQIRGEGLAEVGVVGVVLALVEATAPRNS
jgi:hypothetical protein